MKTLLIIAAWLGSGALGSYIADGSITREMNHKYNAQMVTCREDIAVCSIMAAAGPINLVGGSMFAIINESGQ